MIFDTGALLAIFYGEPGGEEARGLLDGAVMSAVNRAEAVTVLVRDGMKPNEADYHISSLLSHIIPFDTQQSTMAGMLWTVTQHAGLSLCDRACLSLGMQRHEAVLTTDKSWKKISVPAEIHFLR